MTKQMLDRTLLQHLLIALSLLYLFAQLSYGAPISSPRERILFNENWRFEKGDPTGKEGVLTYEKIKNWVRASGNEFVLTSGSSKLARPTGKLGEDVAYTRADFDD